MDFSRPPTWLEMALPVPLRTLLLFYIAPVLLAFNIKGLRAYSISFSSLLDCRPLSPSKLFYLFLKLFLIVLFPAFLLHNVILEKNRVDDLEATNIALKRQWEPSFIFAFSSAATLFLLLMPFDVLHREERRMLLSGLKRTIFGGFQSRVFFSDIILADILTSYSRVIGDFFSSGWQAFFINTSPDSNAASWSDVLTPLVIALPFFFRLRQCTSDFLASGCTTYKNLANALKYASAFPVIFLSPIVAQFDNSVNTDGGVSNYDGALAGSAWLYYSWIFFVIVNSSYSFIWDVFMDWDLGHLLPDDPNMLRYSEITPSSSTSPVIIHEDAEPERQNKPDNRRSSRYFLRPILQFSDPWLYYLVVIINFFLRMTWTFKLSRQFNINHAPFGDFFIEFLELLRRFLWVFLRLEKENIHLFHLPSLSQSNSNDSSP